MAEQVNKPISALTELDSFSGNEKLPLAIGMASNRSAKLSALREYFKDSTLCTIDYIVEHGGEVIDEVVDSATTRDIVYASDLQLIVEQCVVKSTRPPATYEYYTTNFTRWEDYLAINEETGKKEIRQDRVFFNKGDKELYTFNGELNNLFDSVRINAMTEEEFNNLEYPIEGAFYATYDED